MRLLWRIISALSLGLVAIIGWYFVRAKSLSGELSFSSHHPQKNICSFKTVDSFPKIRDGHLGRIVTGSARAIVVPFNEAECLPDSYEGTVNFARVSLEQQIVYGYRQDLKLQMQKSTETYELSELGEDSVALKILGYGTAKELSEDLKSIYGVEATKGKWRWIGMSIHEAKWSRNYSDSPFVHPFADFISKEQLQTKFHSEKVQLIDLREATQAGSIPGAITLQHLPTEVRLQVAAPANLLAYESALQGLDKETQTVVFDNGQTEVSAYNFATVLALSGFKKISILKGGYDAWTGKSREIPNDPRVKVVEGADLITLAKTEKLAIIDVRNLGAYKFRHIAGATNVHVGENINVKAVLSVIDVMSHQTPIIVGKNEHDWRPYKIIAEILKVRPELAKKILWYKKGVSDAVFISSLTKHLPKTQQLQIEVADENLQ